MEYTSYIHDWQYNVTKKCNAIHFQQRPFKRETNTALNKDRENTVALFRNAAVVMWNKN